MNISIRGEGGIWGLLKTANLRKTKKFFYELQNCEIRKPNKDDFYKNVLKATPELPNLVTQLQRAHSVRKTIA